MSDDPYKPIACGDYDIYEIAIMRGRKLLIEWITIDGVILREAVEPRELCIIEGSEYLLYEITDQNNPKKSEKRRLDKIISAKIC